MGVEIGSWDRLLSSVFNGIKMPKKKKCLFLKPPHIHVTWKQAVKSAQLQEGLIPSSQAMFKRGEWVPSSQQAKPAAGRTISKPLPGPCPLGFSHVVVGHSFSELRGFLSQAHIRTI